MHDVMHKRVRNPFANKCLIANIVHNPILIANWLFGRMCITTYMSSYTYALKHAYVRAHILAKGILAKDVLAKGV